MTAGLSVCMYSDMRSGQLGGGSAGTVGRWLFPASIRWLHVHHHQRCAFVLHAACCECPSLLLSLALSLSPLSPSLPRWFARLRKASANQRTRQIGRSIQSSVAAAPSTPERAAYGRQCHQTHTRTTACRRSAHCSPGHCSGVAFLGLRRPCRSFVSCSLSLKRHERRSGHRQHPATAGRTGAGTGAGAGAAAAAKERRALLRVGRRATCSTPSRTQESHGGLQAREWITQQERITQREWERAVSQWQQHQ